MGHAIKPAPRPSAESLPYWEGVKDRKLLLQHCRSCGQFWFPPAGRCRHCLSTDFTWEQASGGGRIYSFVVYHRIYDPGFEDDLPYVVAIIQLDEGPRLLSNIVRTPPEEVRCDLPVRVVFDDDGRNALLPKFEIPHGQR